MSETNLMAKKSLGFLAVFFIVFTASFYLGSSFLFTDSGQNNDPKPDITIDYEGEQPLKNLSTHDVCCESSLQLVSEISHNGEKAAKFTMAPDHNYSKVANIYYKTRNEVMASESLEEVMDRENISEKGKESWYGFSVRPKEDLYISRTYEVIFQLHHINDPCDTQGGNPPIVIYVRGDSYNFRNYWDKDRCQKDWRNISQNRISRNFPLNRGEWTDWVIHTNWKHTEEGILEVWRNGEKVIERHGPVTYNDEKVHTFQYGVYKAPWLQTERKSNRTYYHDNFRASGPGGSYEEVAPR